MNPIQTFKHEQMFFTATDSIWLMSILRSSADNNTWLKIKFSFLLFHFLSLERFGQWFILSDITDEEVKQCCVSLTSHDLLITFSSVLSVVMERRACAAGSQWDSLLKHCISHKSLGLTPSGEWHSWADQCKMVCFMLSWMLSLL